MERSPSSTSISSLPPQPLFSEECFNPNPISNPSFSVEPAPSGSFACTMAALSQPRYMRGPSTTIAGHQRLANFPSENWTEDLEESRWMLMDHGSNLVGAGTSYASSNISMGTELATQPLAGVGMSSENFEDQMMLSMAVSVSEAGARMNSQGPMWL
ncbi:hypothetical protein KSP40_PGU016259 [Platanthera guangdongensis]|uniref:Uncharacterized protein n=1 Tax=Platanthera guangdongensis TaxID=2320717 RepID=A0ABR2N0J0_9ASPA